MNKLYMDVDEFNDDYLNKPLNKFSKRNKTDFLLGDLTYLTTSTN